ncbi:MFS transporter [Bacillus sp. NP157]|nr:MFS transporter [Bacillus sp. NP157]
MLAMVFCAVMAGTTLPAPLYGIYQGMMGLTGTDVSVIFAIYALAVLGSLVLVGSWSDQLGRKPLLYAALAAALISDAIFLQAQHMSSLLVARALSGLSAGLFTAAGTVAIVELAPADRKARAGIMASAANMGGLGLGPLLAGVVSAYLPWPTRLVFVLHAVAIAACVLVVMACPETVRRASEVKLRPRALRLSPDTRRVFPILAMASFAAFALIGLMTSLEPTLLRDTLHVASRAAIGLLLCVVFAASLVGQLIQGRLPQQRRVPSACAVLSLGAVLLACSLIGHSMTMMVIAVVVVGVGQGGVFAASIGEVGLTAAAGERAENMAVLFVVAYLGVALPVLGLGVAADRVGLAGAAVSFCIAMALLACFAMAMSYRNAGSLAAK